MVCSQCGSNVAEESAWCTRCGTQQAVGQQAVGQQAVGQQAGAARPDPVPWPRPARTDPPWPGAARTRTQPSAVRREPSPGEGVARFPAEHAAFSFDARRLARADRIAGIATIALMVTLFLPWFGVNVFGISATADGVTVHGYLYLVLIVALAIIAYLVLYAGFDELPVRLPLAHEQVLLAATGLNFVLVLLAFITKPSLSSWQYGAFAALAAALVAAAPLASSVVRARRNPA
jgi:hypothetical protein